MLNIVCVNTGTKYPNEYVNILCDSITRNLGEDVKFKFVCFTNAAAGLDIDIETRPLPEELAGRGWFNKLYLFKNGLFKDGDRIIYFDLKNVIISSLDDVVRDQSKFIILRDFLRPDGWQSGLMAWDANTLGHIWDLYRQHGYPEIAGGDQIWIEDVFTNRNKTFIDADSFPPVSETGDFSFWQDKYPGAFLSYKVHNCFNAIPKGAKIIFFHGEPRPDQVKDGWVPHVWKIGGGTSLEMINACNTDRQTIIANIKSALGLGKAVISSESAAHGRHAVLVGGGPSVAEYIEELRLRQAFGQEIIALNNSWKWLEKNGIKADKQIMLDAREENSAFIAEDGVEKLFATQCHPSVAAKADKLWNALILDLIHEFETRDMFWIGAGTTVGVRAMFLLYALGYRNLHLYGFDSCFKDDAGHAYEQKLNAADRRIEVTVCGRKFTAAPWMVTQMHDFLEAAEALTAKGCTITLHGDGMIQHVAKNGISVSAPDLRAACVLERLSGHAEPVGAEIGVFTGEMSRRLLSRGDLRLFMVDSWREHGEESEYAKTGDFHGMLSSEQQEEFFQQAKEATEFAGERAKIVRKDSVEAANDFADDSLDFVFLDADHTYPAVVSDLAAWSKKVKRSGVLSGHDYAHPDFPQWGVKQAVDEFCAANGLEVETDNDYTWFVKMSNNGRKKC